MKKLLMMTTAIAGFAMLSAPASAAIDLDLGGHFRGYVMQADNDLSTTNVYEKEFRRDTELHVTGETTLDNGLTVGAHMEFRIADNLPGKDSVATDEVYAYFSGAWGRVNLGVEDGAAYLLQVSAPSADANVDGIAPTIAGADYAGTAVDGYDITGAALGAATATTIVGENTLSATAAPGTSYNFGNYKHATGARQERITYMTPKFNGFQAGVSYAVKAGDIASTTGAMSATKTAGELKNLYELGARYDGEYQGFAFNLGAGYSDNSLAAPNSVPAAGTLSDRRDGVKGYNLGANVMFQNFSLGGAYLVSETNVSALIVDTDLTSVRNADVEGETYVIGAAYDNGPYHVGVSYLDQTVTRDAISNTLASDANNRAYTGAEKNFDRLTLGGGYSFGPGITFRGSVAWGEVETKGKAVAAPAGGTVINPDGGTYAKRDFTQIAIGTDVKF